MGTIQGFFDNPVTLLLSFCVMLYVIKEAITLYKWYKDRADDYHHRQAHSEGFEAKVDALEKSIAEQGKTLVEINKTLTAVHTRLDEYETDRKEDFIVSSRATLYQLYEDLSSKEELTLSEYETFTNLADKYLAKGGNGVFRNKIIPQIKNMKIKDE